MRSCVSPRPSALACVCWLDADIRLTAARSACTDNAHHALFSACNALEDTEDASAAATGALACLRAVYPSFHPEVATLTNALAHTEWHRYQASNGEDGERREAAVTAFQQSLTILRVCVGGEHEAAVQVQKELDFAMASGAQPP